MRANLLQYTDSHILIDCAHRCVDDGPCLRRLVMRLRSMCLLTVDKRVSGLRKRLFMAIDAYEHDSIRC